MRLREESVGNEDKVSCFLVLVILGEQFIQVLFLLVVL